MAKPDTSIDRATKLQRMAALALLLLMVAATLGAGLWSSDVPLIWGRGSASWIGFPRPVVTRAVGSDLEAVPTVHFSKRVPRAELRGPLVLEMRALRGFELRWNGRSLASRPWQESGWKRAMRLPLDDSLLAEENVLEVEVQNPFGPALLWLELDGPGVRVATDETWQVGMGDDQATGAIVADDRRPSRRARGQSSTGQLLREHRDLLLFCFVASALLYLGAQRRLPEAARRRLPEIALLGATAFWFYLFFMKFTRLPVELGFDASAHLDYMRYLLEQRSLPLATDGWSMYHPPLFYGLSAGLLTLFDAGVDSASAGWILRIIPAVSGFAQVFLTYVLARYLFSGDPLRTAVAVIFAAVLPMNVYMSAYVSNETLHGALAGAAFLTTCGLLLAVRASLGALVAVGVLVGLALLTKITSFVLVPGILLALAGKIWLAERASARRVIGGVALVLGVAALVAGWFYLRNALEFGRPIIGNWNVPGEVRTWWQFPGFHTPGYYLSFGASLVQPFFSAFHSFWDGIYASFWGDGLIAGIALEGGPGSIRRVLSLRVWVWNYDFMAIGYVLAFPAALLGLYGFARLTRDSFRGEDLRMRAVQTFLVLSLVLMGYSVFWMTLRLPYYAQAKAFYALALVAPLAVTFAEGFGALCDRLERSTIPWLGAVLFAWAGTLLIVLALSLSA